VLVLVNPSTIAGEARLSSPYSRDVSVSLSNSASWWFWSAAMKAAGAWLVSSVSWATWMPERCCSIR